MFVNVAYDQSVGGAPAGFRSAIDRVVALFSAIFTDPVTINIEVGWGGVSGMTLLPGALGETWVARTDPYSYGEVVAALAAKAEKSPTDAAVLAALPGTDPTNGGAFTLPRATAKALGLMADDAVYDGYVAFSNAPRTFTFEPNVRAVAGLYDFVAVAAHEISHVMGRTLGLLATDHTLMDLFRYGAPGQRALTGEGPAYFSLDGGKTPLGVFSAQSIGSAADWAVGGKDDLFRAAFAPGVSYDLSALDITVMDALGWTVVDRDSAARDDGYIVLADGRLNAVVTGGAVASDRHSSFTDATLIEGAANGSVKLTSDGRLLYEPKAGFSGLDGFTYQVMVDGTRPVVSQAIIHVVPSLPGSADTLDFLALGAEEQIAAAYTAFFGRAPDAPGFAFWLDEYDRHEASRGVRDLWTAIASSFGVSQEAKDLYAFLERVDQAGDTEIRAFLAEVYDNLFNRAPDAAGLDYWVGETKATLASGEFVGSILVDILGGARNTPDGLDVTALIGKVIVGLYYVHQQEARGATGTGAGDMALAKQLVDDVIGGPQSVLVGMRNADAVLAGHGST
jgi:hypothetical protein